MYKKKWIFLGILLILVAQAAAQSRDRQLRERLDSVLTIRYSKTPYYTNYVVRPEGR